MDDLQVVTTQYTPMKILLALRKQRLVSQKKFENEGNFGYPYGSLFYGSVKVKNVVE